MNLWYGSTRNSSLSYCVEENRQCIWWWIHVYFTDCLCNVNDEISFGLGIISLICWGVAESPQIITNFRTKSSHGASLSFLLMWIAADILNLVGCLFEPATLPTQYYTAMLYTTTTLILILQSLYYDYIYKWFKSLKADAIVCPEVEEASDSLSPTITDFINAIRQTSQPRNYYFMSARSFAVGSSPPNSTYLLTTRSRPASSRAVNSSEVESSVEIPETASRPRPIPRAVGYGAFLATSLNLPSCARGLVQVYASTKLLQDDDGSHPAYFGQYLGWLMVSIYLGCRFLVKPLKGLNPLMFMFALIANATYVGSIFARSTEQKKYNAIANMPWVFDAASCAGIEASILIEYLYHRYFKKKVPNSNGE